MERFLKFHKSLPAKVMEMGMTSSREREVLYVVIVHGLNEQRLAWPSLDTLQECTGCSRKVAVSALKNACRLGLLVRKTKGAVGESAQYLLTDALMDVVDLPQFDLLQVVK